MKLFIFGLGYTAGHFVRSHGEAFDSIVATVRSGDKATRLTHDRLTVLPFDGSDRAAGALGATTAGDDIAASADRLGDGRDEAITTRLAEADALLISVQPGRVDPVLSYFGKEIASACRLRAIVYLSTIGVYGDHGGAWIDESADTVADNPRQLARIAAERDWLDLGERVDTQVTVLRLAGIYGPGRNALDDLRAGEARRIDKPGQVFNRIHVADIGGAIAAAVAYRGDRRVFNVTDDEPAPAPDVVAYAAGLMGIDPPRLIPFGEADMSPMARSFYGANRRVRNEALKAELGVRLTHPTYRSGLDALWADGEGRTSA